MSTGLNLKLGSFRDWASMARLPNLPTVWSNVCTAWVLAGAGFADGSLIRQFAASILGGSLLYVGGTVLNDVSDAKFDHEYRPERPIPAGRVSHSIARVAAALLLISGAAFFIAVTNGFGLALPLAIFAYTALHKRFPAAGVVLMGLCRFILAALVGLAATGSARPAGMHFYWACALFAYVSGISWVAKNEIQLWRRRVVGGMLTALPLLDAAFLIFADKGTAAIVPCVCALLAYALRRVASAT